MSAQGGTAAPRVERGWLEASLEEARMVLAELQAENVRQGQRLQQLMAWTGDLHQRAFGEAAPVFELEVRPVLESLPGGARARRDGPGGRAGGVQGRLDVQAVRE